MSEFVVDYRLNYEFKSSIALSFSLEGAGAAALLCGITYGFPGAVLAGLLLVYTGIVVLFAHLGAPSRFWRVISRAKSSWISRGSFIIGCCAGLGSLYFLVPYIFPHYAGTPVVTALAILSVISAVSVMLYPGFLIASMTPVPFWNTPIIPCVFFAQAIATGMSIYAALVPFLSDAAETFRKLVMINGVLLVLALFLVLVHLLGMKKAATAARKSAHALLRGRFRGMFIMGGIFAGFIIPIALSVYMYASLPGAGPAFAAVLMAVSRLGGDFLYRYSVLKAGMFEPLI